MNKFNFYRDRKCSVWERDWYSIEAESKEEAWIKLQSSIEEGFDFEEYHGFRETETLYNTMEELSPKDNLNNSTIEIYEAGESPILIYENNTNE